MGDAAAEAAAAAEKEKKTARLWQLKLEVEAAQRKAKLVKIESQEKTAAVMQAAIDEGLASGRAEMVTIDDEDDPQTAATPSPSNAAIGDLSKILGV